MMHTKYLRVTILDKIGWGSDGPKNYAFSVRVPRREPENQDPIIIVKIRGLPLHIEQLINISSMETLVRKGNFTLYPMPTVEPQKIIQSHYRLYSKKKIKNIASSSMSE